MRRVNCGKTKPTRNSVPNFFRKSRKTVNILQSATTSHTKTHIKLKNWPHGLVVSHRNTVVKQARSEKTDLKGNILVPNNICVSIWMYSCYPSKASNYKHLKHCIFFEAWSCQSHLSETLASKTKLSKNSQHSLTIHPT